MVKYLIYHDSDDGQLYLLNNSTFGVSKDMRDVMLFDFADACNDVYESIGEPIPDMKGWRHVNGHTLCTEKTHTCRGCDALYADLQYDAYSIPTGHWCNDCYESDKYPYKKDRYNHGEFGELLSEENLDDDY